MRVAVKYAQASLARNIGAVGRGTLFLEDRALIVEGIFSAARIPLVGWLINQIIGVKSYRTIPYLAITKYTLPGPFSKKHVVVFKNERRKAIAIAFSIDGSEVKDDALFKQLEALRLNARMFVK